MFVLMFMFVFVSVFLFRLSVEQVLRVPVHFRVCIHRRLRIYIQAFAQLISLTSRFVGTGSFNVSLFHIPCPTDPGQVPVDVV